MTAFSPGPDLTPPSIRDEDGDLRPEILSAVEGAINAGLSEHLRELLADVHEADLGEIISRLEADQRPRLISLMGDAFDFTALTELDDAIRIEILDELPVETLVEGVRELESDDAVEILEDLEEKDRDAIINMLPMLERVALERAFDYEEGTAGRLMKSDFIAVPPFWTIGHVMDHLRESLDLPDDFTEIFVVDPAYKLLGLLRLDRLLRTPRETSVMDILAEAEHRLEATDDQHDVKVMFERYNLLSAPVMDEAGRLVGVLTVDDIVDVIEEEADAEIKALGGVQADEELSDSVWTTAKSRFGWLFFNLITAFLASSVLKSFSGQLEAMVALAVLAPIIASQGGNAATQTMTVVVRALATHELDTHNAGRVIMREVLVAAINGLAFATMTGFLAGAWFGIADLGFVFGLAMISNLIAGALGGVLIPLVLSRLDADPAVASGAFVTTVTDCVGFFSFLGIATWWFRL